jgi:hypothetical protein
VSERDKSVELRIVCGLLASAARLVPVPLLDDLLREKALQLMVSRTLKAHGRSYSSSLVAPLYSDDRGCMHGCLLFFVMLPIKLILYPIRKLLSWFLAAKNLATDLSESVLLGRTLERCLTEGRLRGELADAAALRQEAALLRTAFSNAIAGTDLVILRNALDVAVRSVRGLPGAALHALRGLRKKSDDADPTAGLSAEEKQAVEEGASRIERALDTPEMREWLSRFDTKFDENVRILLERAAAPRPTTS